MVGTERQRAAIRIDDDLFSVIAFQSGLTLEVGETMGGHIDEQGSTVLVRSGERADLVLVEATNRTAGEAIAMLR